MRWDNRYWWLIGIAVACHLVAIGITDYALCTKMARECNPFLSAAFSQWGLVIPSILSGAFIPLAMLTCVWCLQRWDKRVTFAVLIILAGAMWIDAANDIFVITGFYAPSVVTNAIMAVPYHALNITQTC